jgi:hypothetical protein
MANVPTPPEPACLDQNIILAQLRVWHFASPHTVGASVTIEDECLH